MDATASTSTELFCPQCGYNLRGLDSGKCPECGFDISTIDLLTPTIPWSHRDTLGKNRAFFRTAWMATRRPALLGQEVLRPVSYADARLFQRRVVIWLSLWVLVGTLIGLALLLIDSPELITRLWRLRGATLLSAWMETLLITIAFAAAVLFLLFMTGVASYFFHPKYLPLVRQNRAVALSYYACAPMVWMPLTSIIVGASIGIAASELLGPHDIIIPSIFGLVATVAFALEAFVLIRTPLVMLSRATQCGFGRKLALLIGLPISWLLLAILTVGLISFAYVYVCLIVLSFL